MALQQPSWTSSMMRAGCPVAVPEKIFGLTLFLDFFDRCHSLASFDSATGAAAGTTTLVYRNPLRYRGYYYDTETGFYYLQSRYYDPANHRFINADGYASTGQGFVGTNMFAYCNDNPIMCVDPTGTIAITTIILICAAVVGIGVAGYTAYEMTEAGCNVEDTIFYSVGMGLSAFCTVYTFGMSIYEMYIMYCNVNGIIPQTTIGEKPPTNSPMINQTQHNDTISVNIDANKNSAYIYKRGWTIDQINCAINTEAVGTAINKANGCACSVYFYPGTNYYVVIENDTANLVQLSQFGNDAWIPDSTITFFGS